MLLACLPDEQHTLPLEALDAALRERGTATRMLGGAVPAEALTAAVRRTGPGAVVLWSQTRSTADSPSPAASPTRGGASGAPGAAPSSWSPARGGDTGRCRGCRAARTGRGTDHAVPDGNRHSSREEIR